MPNINVFDSINVSEFADVLRGGARSISIVDNATASEFTIQNNYQINITQSNILTENMATLPAGTLKGTAFYDSANQWVRMINFNGNTSGQLEYTNAVLKTRSFETTFGFYFNGSADYTSFYWGCSSTDGGGYSVRYDWFNARILILFNGATLSNTPWTNRSGAAFNPSAVRVTYSATGTQIDVSYNGVHIVSFTDIVRSQPGNLYGWSSFCGGQTAEQRINNVIINDYTSAESAYVSDSVSIALSIVFANVFDSITIQDQYFNLNGKNFGTSLKFSGTNTFVQVTNNAGLNSSVFTYVGWVKPAITNAGVIKGNASAGGTTLQVQASGFLELDKTNLVNMATSNTKLNLGVWNFVAVSYDASGNWAFFINGAVAGTGTNLQTFSWSDHYIGTNPSGTSWFNGWIDDFRIYNAVLSSTVLNSLFLSTEPSTTNLQGLWKFDEGSGTSAIDSSGIGNTGTINNGVYSTDVPASTLLIQENTFLPSNKTIQYLPSRLRGRMH